MHIIADDPNLTTVTIRARRVFKCSHTDHGNKGMIMTRSHVYKDSEGKYHCNQDGSLVEDITDRETGQSFIEVVGL